MKTVVYTRQGCHLCDDAARILVEHGLRPQMVDIDTDRSVDQQLREQYDTCIPVVEIDGKVHFRGRVEPRLLRRLLGGKK